MNRRSGFSVLKHLTRRSATAMAAIKPGAVLITGATAGIGYETARVLAKRGGHVLITGRDADRGERTAAAIRDESGNGLVRFLQGEHSNEQRRRQLCDALGDGRRVRGDPRDEPRRALRARDVAAYTGQYFAGKPKPRRLSARELDSENQERAWRLAAELVAGAPTSRGRARHLREAVSV
jgi:short chain dehydrogenase